MTISRREFCEHMTIGAGLLAGADPLIEGIAETAGSAQTTNTINSHIGNLYPFVQRQADQSPLALSFLRLEFRSLKQWQPRAGESI